MPRSGGSFKPGQSGNPATQFKPGQSGNPGGRRKDPEKFAAFRDLMRSYSPLAAERLRERAEAGDMRAIELILAYAWGKPPQTVDVNANVDVSDDRSADEIRASIAALAAQIGIRLDAGSGGAADA